MTGQWAGGWQWARPWWMVSCRLGAGRPGGRSGRASKLAPLSTSQHHSAPGQRAAPDQASDSTEHSRGTATALTSPAGARAKAGTWLDALPVISIHHLIHGSMVRPGCFGLQTRLINHAATDDNIRLEAVAGGFCSSSTSPDHNGSPPTDMPNGNGFVQRGLAGVPRFSD